MANDIQNIVLEAKEAFARVFSFAWRGKQRKSAGIL